MEVKVLGPGCSKCQKLYDDVHKALRFVGLQAKVSKVESTEEILGYKVLITPALVVNGEVKAAGRIPDLAEMTTWFTTAAIKENQV